VAVQVPPTVAKAFSVCHRSVVRLSRGHLLTRFRGEPMILLTTTGRRTGKERTWPLTGLRAADGWAVAASNGGQARHSAWFHNLEADPRATVTEAGRSVRVRARILEGAERDDWYARFVAYLPVYTEHAEHAAEHGRTIPVVLLTPDDR
jgi:deazaflavin-dependent oxidoreductase (nitroreductase family)